MLNLTHKYFGVFVLTFQTMNTRILNNISPTNDQIIRSALREELLTLYNTKEHKLRILEELGIRHGAARVDIAVVNGIMHGYEIKSDLDTLQRLPEQIEHYNAVFNQMTLVVGKNHLYEAVKMVPEWWGVMLAKIDNNGTVVFLEIREAGENLEQDSTSVARLLWRDEALDILEDIGEADGLRSKPRTFVYEKLAMSLSKEALCERVRKVLFFREDWRPDEPLIQDGDLLQLVARS